MNILNKITLLSLGLILMMDASVVAPILPNIAEVYPEIGSQAIKLIITLPVIFIVIFNPISGKLMNSVNRKSIILLGLALFTVGGMGGALAPNFKFLLLLRSIMGMGLGLISPHVLGTIQAITTGDERVKMTGFVTGLNNLGIIFANITAGMLAAVSWKFPFMIYGVGAILFVLVLLFFPQIETSKTESKEKMKTQLDKKVLFFLFIAIMVSIIFNTLLLNFAMFIRQYELAPTSKIGMMMSTVTFVSFICGFTYKHIAGFLKEKVFLVSAGTLFIGFGVLSFTLSVPVIIFALVMIGLGIGLAYPLLFTSVGKVVAKEDIPFIIALVTSTLYIGRFACPVLVDNLGIILKMDPSRFPFYFSALAALIAFGSYLLKKQNSFSLGLEKKS